MNAWTRPTGEPGASADDARDRPLAVTLFSDAAAATKHEERFGLRALAGRIRATTAAGKKRLPWLKLARFGGARTAKGSLRHDANVLAISGIEADYDGEEIPFADALERLAKADVLALVYTSPSHTGNTPRWRVLCPTSQELPPAARDRLLGRLNGLFGGVFSGESWTLSQAYYYGSIAGNPSHRVEVVDGTPIDRLDDLDAVWRGKPHTVRGSGKGGERRSGRADEAALLAEITSGDAYHEPMVRLLGKWAFDGVPPMEARARLVAAMEAVFPPDRDVRWQARRGDVDRCLEDIYAKEARIRGEGRRGHPRGGRAGPQHEGDGAGPASGPDAVGVRGDGTAGTGGGTGDEAGPVDLTEDALAAEFSRRHCADWRHVAAWGTWFAWTGTRWEREGTLRALDLARNVCRASANVAGDKGLAAKLSRASTVAAVERLARADRRHAATTELWDRDPWLLNTQGGIVDLRTGTLGPHDRARAMTKLATAAPGGECPTWLRFLGTVTGGDAELQAYLRRVVGYGLTGITSEHALFFLYGTGANGKSVFANTLAALLGDYAAAAPLDMFMATKGDRHPTDMAGLRGARVVTSIETEQGSRWAESKLKALTGGDRVPARFMRQDFFEFTPEFKLLVAGNHRPAIRNVDEAMRRRLHMVPFTVTIPPAQRDKRLPDRLLAERGGILAWALEGCLEWQRVGLRPPPAVLAATGEYFDAEDALGRWLEEACDLDAAHSEATAVLYGSWKAWTEGNGEFAGSVKRFAQALGTRGFAASRTSTQRGFDGLRLRPAAPGSQHARSEER